MFCKNIYKLRGFTLIELIIVIVISSILLGAGIEFFRLGFNSYLQGQQIADADWQGRIAINTITNDLHALRSTNNITTATANTLVLTDLNGTSISYQVNNGQLMRNAQILADFVQSITFQYYNEDGVLLSDPIATASIRFVAVNLVINENGAMNFTSGVALWNIM